MDKFLTGLGLAVVAILLITLAAFIGGTIVWLIWPVVIPVVFPAAVASGAVAGNLSWWTSVCLTWLCSLLIRSSTTTTTTNN